MTIKLYAHLMRERPENWEMYVDVLSQEADHQARLVEDVLEISRIDAGRLEMSSRLVSLDKLAEFTVTRCQALAQDQGLILEYRPAAYPGPVVQVDPMQMTQVLDNLVGNAIRYTFEGGAVTVSTGQQETKGRVWATLAVTDTGMGIPEDELPYIFDRFFRGEDPRAMQLTGTGLGLSIAKEIVELHGGRVTVESEKGVGSTFTVWLPLAEQQVQEDTGMEEG
jgi:two-component system sensor histidine kinase VicK